MVWAATSKNPWKSKQNPEGGPEPCDDGLSFFQYAASSKVTERAEGAQVWRNKAMNGGGGEDPALKL